MYSEVGETPTTACRVWKDVTTSESVGDGHTTEE